MKKTDRMLLELEIVIYAGKLPPLKGVVPPRFQHRSGRKNGICYLFKNFYITRGRYLDFNPSEVYQLIQQMSREYLIHSKDSDLWYISRPGHWNGPRVTAVLLIYEFLKSK